MRRERLLAVSVALRALLLAAAAAVMTGDAQAILVLVLVGLEAGLASVFRQVQAALLPWLVRTPDELTRANTAVGVMQSAAMLGGPALAAGLLAVSTPQAAMLAACGLTAVAAAVLVSVRPLSSQYPARAVRPLKRLRRDMAVGFEAGVRRRGVLPLVIPAAAQTFARGVLSVLTVTIALNWSLLFTGNGAVCRENPRRGSPANIAGMSARQPRCLSAAITELGGHRPAHWHAARRGTKLRGRHGTQAF